LDQTGLRGSNPLGCPVGLIRAQCSVLVLYQFAVTAAGDGNDRLMMRLTMRFQQQQDTLRVQQQRQAEADHMWLCSHQLINSSSNNNNDNNVISYDLKDFQRQLSVSVLSSPVSVACLLLHCQLFTVIRLQLFLFYAFSIFSFLCYVHPFTLRSVFVTNFLFLLLSLYSSFRI